MMNKRIVVLALGLITLLTVQSCKKEDVELNRKNVLQIRFTNIGEEKVKQLMFDGKSIGNLSAGETTRYYNFNSVTLNQYNSPIEDAKAKHDGYNIEFSGYDSGENTVLTHGKHTMNIELYLSCGYGLGLQLAE